MKDRLNNEINLYANTNRKKKIKSKFLMFLASLVVFTTTYALILPAITMNTKTWCGKEEHLHNHEECYKQVLTCGKDETDGHIHDEACYEMSLLCELADQLHTHIDTCYNNIQVCNEEENETHIHDDSCFNQELNCEIPEIIEHIHDDSCYGQTVKCELIEGESHEHSEACYESQFACTKDEHEHTKICYSNPNADLENTSIWMKTLPDELTGNWRNDLIEVAKSQLGYKESNENYIIGNNDEIKGYTRYGAWYGDKYGDWCAMFASFCLNYANVDKNLIPFDASCQNWIETLSKEEYNLYYLKDAYKPEQGDLVFFDNDLNGISDHVGIVVKADDKLYTIEGNAGNTVYEKEYKLFNESILGYAKLPENPKENSSYTKQKLIASIYTDASLKELDENDHTKITVEGYLPKDVCIKAFAVEITENVIDGESIMVAYDISVYDSNENIIEIDNTNNPLIVKILPQDMSESMSNASIYYIPEDGEPEELDSSKNSQEITFETPHFSTYAITLPGNMSEVYLDGVNGDDSNDGSSSSKEVETLERALSLVKDGGTIYITNTVTLTDDVDLDVLSSLTIKRSSFTGPLIIIDGAEVTLGNVTINGGSGKPTASTNPQTYNSTNNIAITATYASNNAKAPLILIQDGGTLNIKDGAVLEYNSNKPDTTGSNRNITVVYDSYIGQGGAIYCDGGTLNMSGGTVQYCEAESGGGIYIENGTFNLSGGTIQYNYARNILTTSQRRQEQYYRNAGGGVYVGDYTVMNMSGGMIAYNESSREGGGISLGWLNRAQGAAIDEFITTFNMTGGTLYKNVATSTGGGLNITAGREAYISAGYFLENIANGKEYQETSDYSIPGSVYSGGGIYLDAQQENSKGNYAGKPGYAVISRVLITDNNATSNGGGIATCSTSNYSINLDDNFLNGTLIYNNTKGNSDNEMYLYGTNVNLSEKHLGGEKYNWKVSDNVYTNSLTDNSPGVQEGIERATVIIQGNIGYLGGGIGCNGDIEIGGTYDEKESISFDKIWQDENSIYRPNSITIQVYQDGKPYGEPITFTKTTDESGNEVWPTFYIDNLPKGYEYTIEEIEVDGYISSITQDGSHFTITNTLGGFKVEKIWENDTEEDRPDSIQVQLYQNGIAYGEVVELTKDNEWKHMWTNLPQFDEDGNEYEYSAKEVVVPDGYYSTSPGVLNENTWTITNILSEKTNISVEKKWSEGSPEKDVTVQLLANGEVYREVILNDNNNWYHKFEDLLVKDKAGNDIDYTITEVRLPGYTTDITVGPATSTRKVNEWVSTSELEAGKKYIFVYNNQILSGKNSEDLQWISNASNYINNGTIPIDDAVWNYNGSTLLNDNNKYLNVYKYSAIFGLVTGYNFRTYTSGSEITYSQNQISGIYDDTIYYFSGISSGSGSTSTSSGISFTAYYLGEKDVIDVDENCTHYVITNTKNNELFINLWKYSTLKDEDGNVTLLANAKLALYKEDANGTLIPETDVNGVLVKEWTSSNIKSEITSVELENATYYLVETSAPIGHKKLEGPIVFNVDVQSQSINIISYPGFNEYEGVLSANDESVIDFSIYNEVVFVLPDTGSIGTTWMYIIGSLCFVVSAILIITKKRMNKEI